MTFARWVIVDGRRTAWQWLETAVLTLLAAAIAYRISPSDPFLLRSAFPWLLFAPALLALRYGALPGLASIAILGTLWLLERNAGLVSGNPPALHLTGALILTLVCGEFAGLWQARLSRAEGSLRYVSEKLDRLTRQHYLLLMSHQRLEQDQLARPVTLRAALARIRRLAAEEAPPGELPGARPLMSLLAQFAQLEVASLHECRAGAPAVQPLAAIGPATPLDPADPIVRHCLDTREICHVQTEPLAGAAGERYVVVAPVASSDGRLVALLAVEQMPFLALHQETLSVLAVLLGYYADALGVSRAARIMQRALPGCPIEFADELSRVHRMRLEHDVPSALLLLHLESHPDRADFAAFLRRQMRDLDMIWEPPAPDAEAPSALLLLLPLADAAAAADAIDRLENALETRYHARFDVARIRAYATQIGPGDPFVALKLFLDLHDVRI